MLPGKEYVAMTTGVEQLASSNIPVKWLKEFAA
jgi:hypothetical protein